MAGKKCPNCHQLTFFEIGTGRKCSKCGFEMRTSPNEGMGGKGRRCSNCGKFTVFNGKCRNCNATYKEGEEK